MKLGSLPRVSFTPCSKKTFYNGGRQWHRSKVECEKGYGCFMWSHVGAWPIHPTKPDKCPHWSLTIKIDYGWPRGEDITGVLLLHYEATLGSSFGWWKVIEITQNPSKPETVFKNHIQELAVLHWNTKLWLNSSYILQINISVWNPVSKFALISVATIEIGLIK